jgi:hypothetical protein
MDSIDKILRKFLWLPILICLQKAFLHILFVFLRRRIYEESYLEIEDMDRQSM